MFVWLRRASAWAREHVTACVDKEHSLQPSSSFKSSGHRVFQYRAFQLARRFGGAGHAKMRTIVPSYARDCYTAMTDIVRGFFLKERL